MAKEGSLYFNGKDSFLDLDLVFDELPSIPVSIERVESEPVDGRSGNLITKLGTYDDKPIPVKFILKADEDIYNQRIDEIVEWLNYIEDESLVFPFDNERKYIVKYIEGVGNISKQLGWSDTFQVVFICEPFKYSLQDDIITSSASSFTAYNSGSIKTEPYIKITGTGDITLTINGSAIIFTGVSEYIEIDSVYLLCYKDDYTNNQMSKMNGDFPVLQRGENTFEVTGTVTSVEVNLRTAYL